MHGSMNPLLGKVLTVTGPVEPAALGSVIMHKDYFSDFCDYSKGELASEEVPISPGWRAFMFEKAVPPLLRVRVNGKKMAVNRMDMKR